MKKFTFLIFALLGLGIGQGKGQYTVLHDFNDTLPNGSNPQGSLIISGDLIYGMTYSGGVNNVGLLFSMDTNGNGYKDLLDFNSSNGANPLGVLTLSGSKLFGMTSYGGSYGNIFSINTNGTGYKNLHYFNLTNGAFPEGSLIISGSVLYGMVSQGGIYGWGCIFSIDTTGNSYKELFDFSDSNGTMPFGDLTLSGRVFYGMTRQGGTYYDGCIFSIDTNGNNYKILYNFNGTKGSMPQGSLTLAGGVLYGMTTGGGVNGYGCIFSIDTNGSTYKVLFDSIEAPQLGSLTQIGNKLFGMAGGGAHNLGFIFSIDTIGNVCQDLLDFNSSNGAYPYGSLSISRGTFYGMTYEGGSDFAGVVFKYKDTNIAASLNSLSTSPSLNVYPNPSNGVFTIQSSVISRQLSVEVYNVLGQRVFTSTLPPPSGGGVSFSYEINLSSQPDGVYFYRAFGEDGGLIGEGKVVVQK